MVHDRNIKINCHFQVGGWVRCAKELHSTNMEVEHAWSCYSLIANNVSAAVDHWNYLTCLATFPFHCNIKSGWIPVSSIKATPQEHLLSPKEFEVFANSCYKSLLTSSVGSHLPAFAHVFSQLFPRPKQRTFHLRKQAGKRHPFFIPAATIHERALCEGPECAGRAQPVGTADMIGGGRETSITFHSVNPPLIGERVLL